MSKILELLSSLLNKLIYSISYGCCTLALIPTLIISIIYYLCAIFLIKMKYASSVLLKSQDAFICYDNNPDKRLILFSWICSGKIDIDLFRSKIERGMKNHLRARSYVAEKYGYYFWLPEENFNINEHVIYDHNLSVSTKEEWYKIQKNIYYNFPLSKKKAPWNVHFVRINSDYEEIVEDGPHFYLVFTFDHCLGDGYSVARIFLQGICDRNFPDFLNTKMYFPEETFYKKIYELMLFFVFAPHYAVEYFSGRPVFKRNMLTGNQVFSNPARFNLKTIKEIKNAMKVSLRAVLLTIIMGALENFFKKSSHRMPERMAVTIPQVLWKQIDELEMANNFSLVNLSLPLNEKFCVDRLREINDILMNPKTMQNFLFYKFLAQKLGNLVPSFIGKIIYFSHDSSTMLSMAGLNEKPEKLLQNRKAEFYHLDRMFPLVMNVGILFSTITCGDIVNLVAYSWPSIASIEDVEMIAKDCELELEELKRNICPKST